MERYGRMLGIQNAMQQGELHGLQTNAARRGIADEDALRSAYQQAGGDSARLRVLLQQGGQHKALEALNKSDLEQRAKEAGIGKDTAAAAKSQYEVDIGKLQHETSRNPQPALPPRRGERQMQAGREVVGELQQDERGLVREDADPLRPEPGGNEVFVLACGEVDEPVDASLHPEHAPCAHVLEEELRGVASRGSLPGREVALLRGRGLEEQVPIGL